MITITPGMTNEQLRNLAESVKSGIIQMASDLSKVVDAINADNEAHAVEVENLKNKHAAELAKLIESHEDMTEFVEEMKEFLSAVGKLLNP